MFQKDIYLWRYKAHKNRTVEPSHLSIIESVKGKRAEIPPKQSTFSSKSLTNNKEILIAFAKQFTSPVPHTSDPSTRIVKRRLFKECQINYSVFHIYPDNVLQAIQNSGNSLAAGPDGFTIHHLKNFAPLGLQISTFSTTIIFPSSGNTELSPNPVN